MTALAVLALVVAVIAAIRGTWSPCGLSMLSTITPVAEHSRGHRYGATVVWFIVGSTVGGACLGGVAALGALAIRALSLGAHPLLVVAAVAAAVGVASDLRLLGWSLPLHPRQVNETWLNKYRRWVYAAGFGWQIGNGFATYIMSAAVYLTATLAVLTGRPVVALGVGIVFGIVRGSAVLIGARATSIDALGALHRRLARWEPASRVVAVATQAGVGTAAVTLAVSTGSATAAFVGLAVALAVPTAMALSPSDRKPQALEM